jgi:hypothetical protein
MKNLLILIFSLFICVGFSQTSCCYAENKLDSLHQKHTSYKVQILSSLNVDKTKFKYFIENYRCEVEHFKTKVGKDVYRYLIVPKENTLYSANLLLDEVFYHFQNPFIVVFYKGKRQN